MTSIESRCSRLLQSRTSCGVTDKRSRTWLRRFISQPDKLLDENDPTALALVERYKRVRMPNLRLADADIDVLIDFLQKHAVDGTAATPARRASKRSLQ